MFTFKAAQFLEIILHQTAKNFLKKVVNGIVPEGIEAGKLKAMMDIIVNQAGIFGDELVPGFFIPLDAPLNKFKVIHPVTVLTVLRGFWGV